MSPLLAPPSLRRGSHTQGGAKAAATPQKRFLGFHAIPWQFKYQQVTSGELGTTGIRGGEEQGLVPKSITAPKNPFGPNRSPVGRAAQRLEKKRREKAALGGRKIPVPPSIPQHCWVHSPSQPPPRTRESRTGMGEGLRTSRTGWKH